MDLKSLLKLKLKEVGGASVSIRKYKGGFRAYLCKCPLPNYNILEITVHGSFYWVAGDNGISPKYLG